MTPIPPKIRKLIDEDPQYKTCMLYGQGNHVCEGRITMDHAVEFAGSQVQELFAIIAVCARGHGVDNLKADVSKEMRLWVAINRASHDELTRLSKAESYFLKRNYLNDKYGKYEYKMPDPLHTDPTPHTSKKDWYLIEPQYKHMVDCIVAFNKHILGINRLPRETISALIEDEYLTLRDQASAENKELLVKLGFK